jgi:hypothetical protein
MGGAWGKRETELEELKLKAELRREEKMAELQQRRELAEMTIAARAEGGDPLKKVAASYLQRELSAGPTDRSQFQKEVAPSTETDELGNTMPMIKQDDTEGYNKAEAARRERDLGLINRVKDPNAWDDVQKGEAQAQVNRLGKLAGETKDPKAREGIIAEANKMSLALFGKERYKISSNGQVMDVAEGDVTETDLSKSKTDREKAAATEDRAQAGSHSANARESDAKAKLADRTDPNAKKTGAEKDGTLSNDQVIRAYSEARKALDKNPKDKEAQADFAVARAEYRKRFGEKEPGSAPAADALPAPTTRSEVDKLKPGTRFRAPDGSIRVR